MNAFAGLESIVQQNAPLAPRTWLNVGGAAEYFAEPENLDQLKDIVTRCYEHEIAVRILGGGSNVLVRDEGVPGMVLHLKADSFSKCEIAGTQVSAGGGAALANVIGNSVGAGLAGLEILVGIPGSVGGALHGNAGTQSGDIGQWTQQVTVLTRTGEIAQRGRDELVFSYRESSVNELAILEAVFELEQDDPQRLTKSMQKHWIVKKAAQPAADSHTAILFKNPRGMDANQLIDQAGQRGARVGGAELSTQANGFVTVQDEATAADVMQLIEQVQRAVLEQVGAELESALDIW